MIGSAEINESEQAKDKAAQILAQGFSGVDIAFCKQAINNVRLCTVGDNKNFFELNSSYIGVTGQ